MTCTRAVLLLAAWLFALPALAAADPVRLQWDQNQEPGVAYIVYRGDASRTYTEAKDVGTATTATFEVDPTKRHYFAARAYDTATGVQGELSNEVIWTASAPPPPPPPPPPTARRINVGGPAYTDSVGRIWEADSGSVGTSGTFTTDAAISNTTDQTLYKSERYGGSWGYRWPVVNGAYDVDLHFAEIYWGGAQQRVFDVLLENALVLDDLDIWSRVGMNAAFTSTHRVSVTDGVLTLDFRATAIDLPKLSAVAFGPATTVPPPPPPPPPLCTLTLNGETQLPSGGSTGQVSVTATDPSCAWTVTSSQSWYALTSASGKGTGTVPYTVAANPGDTRTVDLAVGTARLSVTQDAAPPPPPCAVSIAPTSLTFARNGGSAWVSVQATCSWAMGITGNWWSVSTTTGTAGTTPVLVSTRRYNGRGSRAGTIEINGHIVTLVQQGR